jgi:hypothetical protein
MFSFGAIFSSHSWHLTLSKEYYLTMVQGLSAQNSEPSQGSEQDPEPPQDEAAGTGDAAVQGPAGKGWLTSPLAKGIGALLLAVIPASGVYFSPWFQEHWDPPSKSVTLGAVCLETGITRASFYSGYGIPAAKITDPDTSGLLVSIALTANGFDGDNIYLRSDVLNTVSGVEALGSLERLSEVRAVPVNASAVMRDPQIWVPVPTTAGQYVVLIRVSDGDLPSGNQGLASAYSRTFTVDSDGRLALSGLCTGS